MADIEIHASYSDILAGVRHDARVARAEGFPRVAERAELLERELEAAAASAPPNSRFLLVFRAPD